MPNKRDEFDDYLDEYGQDAFDELMESLGEFPELDYLDDILSLDDDDFYSPITQ
ncbi:hypothetical protein L0244_38675 [bacterium]|nr:hypothetical protein [bacterium]